MAPPQAPTALAASIADCLESLGDLDDLKPTSIRLRTFNFTLDRFVRLGPLYFVQSH
jgi:hypothetical protein